MKNICGRDLRRNWTKLIRTCIAASICLSLTTVAQTNGGNSNSNPDANLARWEERLSVQGIDPHGQRGNRLADLLARYSGVSDSPANLATDNAVSKGVGEFGLAWNSISPSTRLDLMRSFRRAIVGLPKSQCSGVAGRRFSFATVVNFASPSDFDGLMQSFDAALSATPLKPGVEYYSTDELLEMESQLSANLFAVGKRHGWPDSDAQAPEMSGDNRRPNECEVFVATIDAIDDLPEPQRSQATWASVAGRESERLGRITNSVLADPLSYLDESFDIYSLPEAFRRHLPPEGARPLPFRELTFRGTWIRTGPFAGRGPFDIVFVNRRNDGVMAAVVALMPNRGEPASVAHFAIGYGKVTLRAQMVAPYPYLSPVALFPGSWESMLAASPITENSSWKIEVPQPAGGIKNARCVAERSHAARTLSPVLTGKAFDISCRSEAIADPKIGIEVQGVYLSDYDVHFPTAWIYKTGDVIRFELEDVTMAR